MKNTLSLLACAFVASALTAGGIELLRDDGRASAEPVSVPERVAIERPAPPSSAAPDPSGAEALARLAELERRLAQLEAGLDASRQPVAAQEEVDSEPIGWLGGLGAGLEQPDEKARAFVLDVVEQERQVREEERAEERRRWDEERLARQASSAAERLGLSAQDEENLLAILLEERERRTAFYDTMREGGFDPTARDLAREEFARIEAWKSEELGVKFGSELASKILDLERERRSDRWGSGMSRGFWDG